MAADFGLVYPLWNHTRAADSLLDRVVGEVGIDHLTVPVVTGEQTQFRLSGGFESPYFHTEGGWHFPPQAKLYAASGVKPRVAKWCGTRDVLAEVREKALKLGVPLIMRVDLPAVRGLVDQTPKLRCRSAWGDDLASLGPCVCNPDFRELVQATLADLARYQPIGFELEHLDPTEFAGSTQLPPAWQWALFGSAAGLCFCSACRQLASAAGIDADAAAEGVREYISTVTGRSLGDVLEGDDGGEAYMEAVQPYGQAREVDCRQWVARLSNSQDGARLILLNGDPSDSNLPPRGPWPECTVMTRLNPLSIGSEVLSFAVRMAVAGGSRGLCVPVVSPELTAANTLVQAVSAAVAQGIEFFDFEQLEESPAGVVTWLKQAVRYARRD